MNWIRRQGDNSNTVIGIILLILLLVFVGPNTLPTLLSRSIPFVDEGIPCSALRTAQDRAAHQSLIGRLAQDPLSLRVDPDTIPTSTTPREYIIRLIVTNNTIGTVPIVFNPNQVIVGDDGASGFGIVFNQPVSLRNTNARQVGLTSFPEADIRLLGPRQTCVHRLVFGGEQIDAVLRSGSVQVQAYYRITTPGAILGGIAGSRFIYNDQGLAIIRGGLLRSQPVPIPVEFTTP